MIPQDIAAFSFSSWYPKFKHITFKSEIIPLSESAIAYLREDGIHLPTGVDSNITTQQSADEINSDDDNDTNENHQHTEWSSSDEEEEVAPWIVELKIQVDGAICRLGGNVFPKLNWSSPKDASWMLPNRNLKCSSLSDVLLLMKASTFVSYDLSLKVQEQGRIPLELVLREWSEINPGWEFRCFVKNATLIGISQRHTTAFYPHMTENSEKLTKNFKKFFRKSVLPFFPLKNYTFDVVTFTFELEDFQLVDFNPFDSVTDSLLFSWNEMNEMNEMNEISDEELLRVVSYPLTIQPDGMRQFEIPADFMDSRFTTNGRSLFEFLGAEIGMQGAIDSDGDNPN